MKPSKIRDQSVEELRNEEDRLKEEIFKLRFQNAIGQLDNPIKLRIIRKDLARVKTVLNEKSRAEAKSSVKG